MIITTLTLITTSLMRIDKTNKYDVGDNLSISN